MITVNPGANTNFYSLLEVGTPKYGKKDGCVQMNLVLPEKGEMCTVLHMEELDILLIALSVLRNACALGVELSSSLYSYVFPAGGYMIGSYEEGIFLCLYYHGPVGVDDVYTLAVGEQGEVDEEELEVWPAPSE